MQDRTDLFGWVAKIIDTCCHDFHFECIDKLIELYYEREKDEAKRDELELMKVRKWNEIHVILN